MALLICWGAQGRPHYSFVTQGQVIPYISDIAATNLQPIFISCAAVQGLLMVLAMASERWLRHTGRLLPNDRKREKVFAGLAIGFAIIGQLGILFVSIFNTRNFHKTHIGMLCVFIVGLGVSSLFFIWELLLLDRSYTNVARLRKSYIFKIIWFIISLGLALGFAIADGHGHPNGSSGCEWALSFFYGFYLISLAYDLYPAAHTHKGELLTEKNSFSSNVDNWVPGIPSNQDLQPGYNQDPNQAFPPHNEYPPPLQGQEPPPIPPNKPTTFAPYA